MNTRPVNGTKLLEVKGRLTTLQEAIRSAEFKIQTVRDTRSAKQELAKRRNMSPSEFLLLFPSAPVMASENALLAAKEALLGSTVDQSEKPLEQAIFEIQSVVNQTASNYLAEKIKPTRSLTDGEFSQLNPALTDGDFVSELGTIATAKAEADLLGSFMKSGPYPAPGQYDTDLLASTAITFP
jgi:hypothetical protein